MAVHASSRSRFSFLTATFAAVASILGAAPARAQPYPIEPTVYHVHPRGSTFFEGCWGVCACVLFLDPARGQFTMELESLGNVVSIYRVASLNLEVPTRGTEPYGQTITGDGRLSTLTGFRQQSMTIDVGFTLPVTGGSPQHLESGLADLEMPAPSLARPVVRIALFSNEHGCPGLGLRLEASPFKSDWNSDGVVSLQDLLDYLGDYFAGGTIPDYDGSGSVAVGDLLAFTSDWFTGV